MQASAASANVIMTSQSPPFTLPIRYLLLGVIGFGLFAVDLVVESVNLGQGRFFLPEVVALTHLLTLGSLLAFVMGAVYQLSTVAFLIPLFAKKVAQFNFWLYTVSVSGLILSMLAWWTPGIFGFGVAAIISIYVYAAIMLVSVYQAKVGGAMKWFVLFAHLYLIIAVSLALLMVLSIQFPGFLAGVFQPLLLSHILFAVGGFFSFLVMGFSYKLLPMFTLAHGFSTVRQKWTLLFANLSLWGFVAGVWADLRSVLWVAGVVGGAAFFIHLFDLRAIVKHRMRKKIEPPMVAVIAAAAFGFLGLLFLLVQLGLKFGAAGWQGIVSFFLVGWITFTMMGYAYKIIPFLIWNERYSKKSGKEKVPLIADMIRLRQSIPVLAGFGAGLVLVSFSAVLGWAALSVLGGVLLGVSIILFCLQLLRVINLKKVGKEMWGHD